MKQESNFKESVRHYLFVFTCICILKGIILPAYREHNRRKQAKKDRVETYQTFLSNYKLYMMTRARIKADRTYVDPTTLSLSTDNGEGSEWLREPKE